MKHRVEIGEIVYTWDDKEAIDLSIPIFPDHRQPNCFYAPLFEVAPVRSGDFVGSTTEGGPVNFMNLRLNPHGNGTHTECVGHISKGGESINKTLLHFFSLAQLVTIYPEKAENGDKIITLAQLKSVLSVNSCESLVIRTMPNHPDKKTRNYSGTNPAYLSEEAMQWIVEFGVQHLLIDLPSVDPEVDGGKLLAHRAFWDESATDRSKCTITELIYVDNNIKDDLYLLNIQIGNFELDVSPSKPVLYALEKEN